MEINWLNGVLLGNALLWTMIQINGTISMVLRAAISKQSAETPPLPAILMILSWMAVVTFWIK